MARVTIIGTGTIGTSLGLALKQLKAGFEIVGHDRDHGKAGQAKKVGAIDRAEWNLPAALDGAALVIVATPIAAMQKLFEQMAPFVAEGAVITDTASLKGPVLEWARPFAGRANFVGGHPVVSIVDGSAEASATLFQGATYCIVPAIEAQPEAIDQVARLAQAVGATPLFLDPIEHDSHMAIVSQLPQIMAAALVNVATGNPGWRDGRRLAGAVFGSTTALAAEHAAEQSLLWNANRDGLLRWVGELQIELSSLTRMLEDDPGSLEETLTEIQSRRATWRPGLGPELPESPNMPTAREQMSTWFLGSRTLGKKK